MSLPSLSSLFGRKSAFQEEAEAILPLPYGLLPERARELAQAAWLKREEHGSIAQLSRTFNVSRDTVNACREAFEEHLSALFQPNISTARMVEIKIDRASLARTLILARAELAVSVRSLKRLTALFYGFTIGFGTVWNTIHQAEFSAKAWLSKLSLDNVSVIALDELYSQGMWVLIVIDVKTQTLCGLRVVGHRTKAAWDELLTSLRDEQGLHPKAVVSDAGSSVIASCEDIFCAAIQQRDIFHAKQELIDLLAHLERQAYRALASYYELLDQKERARPEKLKSLAQRLRWVGLDVDYWIALHDKVLILTRRAFEAMEFIDLKTGSLKQPQEATSELMEVAQLLRRDCHKRLRKVGTYLANQAESLTAYFSSLNTRLCAIASNIDELGCVLTIASVWRIDRDRRMKLHSHQRFALTAQRNALLDGLLAFDVTGPRLATLAIETCQAIQEAGRASSIVECFNSVQRQYLQVHKRANEGALYLLAARWNLAQRSAGVLKDSCPYTALTGERVDDWLSMLDLPEPQANAPGEASLAMLLSAEIPDDPRATDELAFDLAA